ncbi:hypothetical protein ACLKA7_007052 [Drosophila subpalustris]
MALSYIHKSSSVSSVPHCGTPRISGRNVFADDLSAYIPQHERTTRNLLEEISGLRKENFNLKVRLYAKNENHSRINTGREARKDNIVRELEYAKKTIEVLNKDIEDKRELLLEATTAIERHEEIYKVHVLKTQSKMAEQEQYIGLLESKVEEEAASKSTATSSIKNMHLMIMKQNDDLVDAYGKIQSLEEQLEKNKSSLDSYVEKANELCQQNRELMQLSEEHYTFSTLANQLLRIQKLEIQIATKQIEDLHKKLEKNSTVIHSMSYKFMN